jgi:hypothetical protein
LRKIFGVPLPKKEKYMKRIVIVVLVLVVIGIGFYWGYQKATSKQKSDLNKPRSGGTKFVSSGSISISSANPTTIPQDAITRETTMVVNLNTPTTIFDDVGNNSKLEITVKPKTTDSNTVNQKQYILDIMLSTPPPSIRMISSKIATAENKQFTFSIGGNPAGNTNKGSSILLDGTINSLNDNQVQVAVKLNTW